MKMTLDQILSLLGTLSLLIPVPAVSVGIPMLVSVARDLAKSGLFDASVAVELDTIGDEHRKALDALLAELAKHPAA